MAAAIRHPTTPPSPPPSPPAAPAPTLVPTTTTTTATPAPPVPVTPAATAVSTGNPGAVSPAGQATTWGCAAALAYLQAYAAPGFTFECPGYADGHDAMTCVAEQASCPGAAIIAISDACPQAYMNEASNSWVLTGRSDAPIDPYGACPS